MVSKKQLLKENDELKQRMSMFTMSLAQIGLDKRDMYLGPSEFILSQNHLLWKDVEIKLAGEDITKSVSKIVVSGPHIISD